MGLDVSYFRNATFLRPDPQDDSYDWEGGSETAAYPNSDFADQADGLVAGVYRVEDSGGFRAGAYSAYNRFREQLAAMAGYTPEDAWEGRANGKPFQELVNFSDCNGMIGPKTSAKLAADFAAHQATADVNENWMHVATFADMYRSFRLAFETAAQDGFVQFH
jgi:hypothetical protein